MTTATKLSGTYAADPVHSNFAFSVRYQGVSLFRGSLEEFQHARSRPVLVLKALRTASLRAARTIVVPSAYLAEIFRAGLESVSPGQNEAARSTGLNARQAMAYVVVPQGVRNVIPDLASNTLEAIKQTSIASAVALPELLRSAQIMQGETYSQTPLVAAALIYFLLLWPLVRMISRMQKPFVIPR